MRAKIPATTPNDAAVTPLLREPSLDCRIFVLFALRAREFRMALFERNISRVRRCLGSKTYSSRDFLQNS